VPLRGFIKFREITCDNKSRDNLSGSKPKGCSIIAVISTTLSQSAPMRRDKIVDTSLFARISSSFLQRNNFMKKNLNNGCCWFNKTTSPTKKKISKEARRWERPPSSFPPLHFPLPGAYLQGGPGGPWPTLKFEKTKFYT
jgi:hypothetical protein